MRYLMLLSAILLTACTPYNVGQVPPHVIGRALDPTEVAVLLGQAVRYSRYQMPPVTRLPVVDVVPEALWLKLKCPGLTTGACGPIGYYTTNDPKEAGVVHVRDLPAEYNRPYPGIAVHELVHWLQVREGRGAVASNCPLLAANEAEAYAVEYVNDLANGHLRPFQMGDILAECYFALGLRSVRRK